MIGRPLGGWSLVAVRCAWGLLAMPVLGLRIVMLLDLREGCWPAKTLEGAQHPGGAQARAGRRGAQNVFEKIM